MSKEGRKSFETQQLPEVKKTQPLVSVADRGNETSSLEAGALNVEMLQMEHLTIFQDMKTALAEYVSRHTGTFGSMRRDDMSILIQDFEAYLIAYYTALHTYAARSNGTSTASNPRAHEFNLSNMQTDIQRTINGVCDAVISDETLKKSRATVEVQQKVDEFNKKINQRILQIISRLPQST
jgi:hypothetical protein